MAEVLDPCCGSRMMWFNREDPRAVFGDIRAETVTVTDRTHRADGTRTLTVAPDRVMDFRALPYDDGSFKLVVFDPPHLNRAGPRSWLRAKYGALDVATWRDDLRAGFAECFRVLEPHGVLVFKWNETQIPVREVLALTDNAPLFGHQSGKRSGTHWICFMKPPNAGKGDRPGWLCMAPEAAVLEVHHHVAKLQKAVLTGDQNGVREYAADVANMSMMAVDVCRALTAAPAPGKGGEA